MRKSYRRDVSPKLNLISRIISVIYVVFVILFIVIMSWLKMLPAKFFWPMVIILVFASIFIVPVMFSKRGRRTRKIIATVFAVILILVFAIGSFLIGKTVYALEHMQGSNQTILKYYVITLDGSNYLPLEKPQPEEKSDQEKLLDKIFGAKNDDDTAEEEIPYYTDANEVAELLQAATIYTYKAKDINFSEAKNYLNEICKTRYQYVDDAETLYTGLKRNSYKLILVSDIVYETLAEEDENIQDITEILLEISIEKEEVNYTTEVDVTTTPFNIFVSGCDYLGNLKTKSRSDVNMLISVNPVTHKVLITTIPRDYYVKLHTYGEYDKLTHASMYGVQESVATVSDLIGVDINYYVRVNFSSLIKIVDAIGGVTVESEYTFTTSGMGASLKELNGLTFKKGTNKLNGKQALAFCRERHSFANGDMQRNKNQQIVLEAIIKKLTTNPSTLAKYGDILDSVQGKVETNMTLDDMAKIVNMQLKDNPSWTITKMNITGKTGSGECYTIPGRNLSIVKQDDSKLQEALDKIFSVISMKGVEEGTN